MKRLCFYDSRLFPIITFLVTISIALNSCSKSTLSDLYVTGVTDGNKGGMGELASNEVWIEGMEFIPPTIAVSQGTEIIFINKDRIIHPDTNDNGLFDSALIGSNESYILKFINTGSCGYYCALHQVINGVVFVY